ncbi:acyl-CoA carboxylase subunit beta [Chloroflexota bacterium]
MDDRIELLRAKKAAALLEEGGQERMKKQHERGKLTARERLAKLLDPDSFVEHHMLAGEDKDVEAGIYGDGVITGFGKINGRRVAVYSQDATVHAGSTGAIHREKLCELINTAIRVRLPLIGLHDSAGGRMKTQGEAITKNSFGIPSMFGAHTRASGLIPQITVILGSCAGNAVYGPALTDFIFVVKGVSYMFVTGPRVVKEVMSTDVTKEELGGARVHSEVSGVADFLMNNEEECFQQIRRLVSFLPSNNTESPPIVDTGDGPNRMDDDLNHIVPTESKRAFDMHQIINRIVDNGDFFEVKTRFARNMIVGFARLNGRTVGFVANQPMVYAGALTVNGSDKEARFIRFCDAFNIPLVFLAENPGYMPGIEQEHAGIIRHGAKVLYAINEATVPKITVLIRKCVGGGGPGMNQYRDIGGADRLFAWTSFEGRATTGVEGQVSILYRKEIAEAENPDEYRAQKVKEFQQRRSGPFDEAASGRLDDVFEPRETRPKLISHLEMLADKADISRLPKKHGNMPM